MQTAVWGPSCWKTLAFCALNYPEIHPTPAQKSTTTSFLRSLMNILPCRWCRESSLKYIEEFPPEPFLNDRAGFCYFLYHFHQKVNAKLGKNDCSFIDFISQYEKYRAKCGSGLGCNIPKRGKCPQEIREWCDNALAKYANYQQIIDDWKYSERMKKSFKIIGAIVICLLSLWFMMPRLRQIFKIIQTRKR